MPPLRHSYDSVASTPTMSMISTRKVGRTLRSCKKPLPQEAVTQGRVLVTHNISHFVTLHRSYLAEGRSHAGIVVTPVRPIGTLLTRLIALHETTTAEEMASTLRFL